MCRGVLLRLRRQVTRSLVFFRTLAAATASWSKSLEDHPCLRQDAIVRSVASKTLRIRGPGPTSALFRTQRARPASTSDTRHASGSTTLISTRNGPSMNRTSTGPASPRKRPSIAWHHHVNTTTTKSVHCASGKSVSPTRNDILPYTTPACVRLRTSLVVTIVACCTRTPDTPFRLSW